MNDPSTTGHAGWFRDVRRILEVVEITPGLPIPHINRDRATFFFTGAAHAREAAAAVRTAETILRSALLVTFCPRRTHAGSTAHYILTAVLPSGLMVDLVALARHIDGEPATVSREPELEMAA